MKMSKSTLSWIAVCWKYELRSWLLLLFILRNIIISYILQTFVMAFWKTCRKSEDWRWVILSFHRCSIQYWIFLLLLITSSQWRIECLKIKSKLRKKNNINDMRMIKIPRTSHQLDNNFSMTIRKRVISRVLENWTMLVFGYFLWIWWDLFLCWNLILWRVPEKQTTWM